MIRFATTRGAAVGHAEIVIELAERPVVPGIERALLGFLEDALGRRTVFRPGETVRFGWTTLRVSDRGDGTLGLEQRERVPSMPWSPTIDHALHDAWFQKELCASLDLPLDFPAEDDLALVTPCALEAGAFLFLRVDAVHPGFSGWMLSCAAEHDHGEHDTLPLLAIASIHPALVQLFALPRGHSAWVRFPAGRVSPRIFRGATELRPRPGSYLAALQEGMPS